MSIKFQFNIFYDIYFSSISIINTTPSTSLLHIGSEQKLRDLYPNIRVNVTSPRKIFFKRVKISKEKKTIKFEIFFSYLLIILNLNIVVYFEYMLQIQEKKIN